MLFPRRFARFLRQVLPKALQLPLTLPRRPLLLCPLCASEEVEVTVEITQEVKLEELIEEGMLSKDNKDVEVASSYSATVSSAYQTPNSSTIPSPSTVTSFKPRSLRHIH